MFFQHLFFKRNGSQGALELRVFLLQIFQFLGLL
jgi:hypothetical protein